LFALALIGWVRERDTQRKSKSHSRESRMTRMQSSHACDEGHACQIAATSEGCK